MLRSLNLLILSLLVTVGCKSGQVVRLQDRTMQEYRPAIPENAVAASRMHGADAPIDGSVRPQRSVETQIQQVSSEGLAADSAPGDSARDETNGISLQQSIFLALSQNPDLVTLRQTENVSQGALGVAQTYPFNPFLQVQATPYQHTPAGNSGTMYHYVLLMQTIQLAHQQQYREHSAASTLNSTRWSIHQAELVALAATERLYFTALYQHGIMELAEASDRNNRQLLRILENQLEAGQAPAADVAIVRVDAASTHQQLQLVSANYKTAVRDLARQIGVSPDNMQNLNGDLQKIEWRIPGGADSVPITAANFDFDTMITESQTAVISWASSRPDVMAAHSDIDVARANQCLASASRTPDLQIGPYYQTSADGTNYVGFRGQIDLPVLNTGEPLERQRSAEHRARCVGWQQTRRRAELDAIAAFDRYCTALTAATADTESIGADLPAALEGLEHQFMEGEVDITRVVQARTSLIQNQRSRLDLLNEVAQSAASLTAATGIPLDQVFQMNVE